MKSRTSYKIGGDAKHFFEPVNRDQLVELIYFLQSLSLEYFVIGNGTNLLISDRGVDKIIISTKKLNCIEKKGNFIYVDGGVSIPKIASFAKRNNLSGFEGISGIPGSVGGGIFMNCGALGSSISDHLYSLDFLDSKGSLVSLKRNDVNFSYRETSLGEGTIISAVFDFDEGSEEEISKLMDQNRDWRLKNQPLNAPSCGSVFKKCKGESAGAYIDKAGLKGYRKGGAIISNIHANFFLNIDNCSFDDIDYLISLAKEKVYDRFGVELEEEVIRIGK